MIITLTVVTVSLTVLQCFHIDKNPPLYPEPLYVFVAASFLILLSHSNSSHSAEATAPPVGSSGLKIYQKLHIRKKLI